MLNQINTTGDLLIDNTEREHCGRPRLIFQKVTNLGLLSIWKVRYDLVNVYNIQLDDAETSVELQRQKIVRFAREPLKHVIMSLDGNGSYYFEETNYDGRIVVHRADR